LSGNAESLYKLPVTKDPAEPAGPLRSELSSH
jgi:hypothetical protein